MKHISPSLSARRAAAGRAGGYATFFRYGREQMVLWAKKGGRPRSLTLAEIESRVGSLDENKKEKGERLPAVRYSPAIERALGLTRHRISPQVNKRRGELAAMPR